MTQLQQLIGVEAGLVQILFYINKKINKSHFWSGTCSFLFKDSFCSHPNPLTHHRYILLKKCTKPGLSGWSLQRVRISWWPWRQYNCQQTIEGRGGCTEEGWWRQRREKSRCRTSIPLLHLYFRGLEKRPVLFLLALLSLCLERPPTVHTSISWFLVCVIYGTNPFKVIAKTIIVKWLQLYNLTSIK